jgi:hypothetical protein
MSSAGTCYSEHVTDALISLHWLRAPERIEYKIAVLTFRVIHGSAPRYLGTFERIASRPNRYSLVLLLLIIFWYRRFAFLLSSAVPFRLAHKSGTICVTKLHLPGHCQFFVSD